jgi:hypothetical protein
VLTLLGKHLKQWCIAGKFKNLALDKLIDKQNVPIQQHMAK